MHTRRRTTLILIPLLALAAALAWSLPRDVVARSMFQSPANTPVPTATSAPTATPQPSNTPSATITASPTATQTHASGTTPVGGPSPTLSPTETVTATLPTETIAPTLPVGSEISPTLTPSPGAGFLPPPTLTSPDELPSGALPSLLPGSQPPLSAPAAPPPEQPAAPANAPSDVPGVAQLIDNGIVALSYVWLCCGVLFLIGATLILVWLVRRSQRRRSHREAGDDQSAGVEDHVRADGGDAPDVGDA